MATIIEQIQRDALDENVSVSSLLRRMKFAAAKLNLGAVEDWVEQELSGYQSAESVPAYRIIYGRPMSQNPVRGWEQIGGSVEGISKRHIAQSIASLEELIGCNSPNLMTDDLGQASVRAVTAAISPKSKKWRPRMNRSRLLVVGYRLI